MKFVALFALFLRVSAHSEDIEGAETTVPVGYGSNYIDNYGGSSFIGRSGGFGGSNLGFQQGLGYQEFGHQGLGHQGLGQQGLGYQGLGYQGLGHQGLGHQGLGHQGGLGFGGHLQSSSAGFHHGLAGNFNQLGHGRSIRNGLGGFGGSYGSIGGGLIGHHPHGGQVIDQSSYNSGKKNLEDGSFEKSSGNKIAELSQGENGYTQGKVGQLSSKGDSGYFNDQQAAKKLHEDGKVYNGGNHFNQQGQSANENKQELGHKKGHVIKGFKSSHHKDETGKTEEYYDEAHDEGDNFKFQGQAGKYGEGSQLSFNGGHDDKFYNADEKKKQGHYDGQQYVDKNNADRGQYGQNKYIGNGQEFGVNNGVDQQALLGHQEHSQFYKHHPYHSHFYR